MTERTKQLLAMAGDHSAASSGEQQLFDILKALRSLNRDEIRYRFESKEISELVEFVLFEEALN
ncbi:MAG: hypothetical protein PHI47_13680 [Sulfuricurvum sp.]|uniref:hypothetical protein n=1 Tax=Sulfuricurvum sp. TaxID=2025608 RepID=UPI002624D54D|nr:hypothetical protein [Sulfuricurvum sp.]MDD5065323.1 hypothetical protein [Phycisphaerae bacterium]MDD5161096.1 hypothetical protein [Sulfuricurvum sp.]